MDDAEFLRRFEDCSWPSAEWRHRQHIKMAYLYLRQMPIADAVAKAREAIKRYNAAHHVPEAIDRGYHDTVTVAWMRLVNSTLQHYGPCESADAFCDLHPQLLEPKILRLFYSRERIMSAEAKAGFIEPDITPLPEAAISG